MKMKKIMAYDYQTRPRKSKRTYFGRWLYNNDMDIFRISFYDQFQCLAGDCSETCCKGFAIPVEERIYEKLRAAGGLTSLKARFCITGETDDRLLNRSRRKCPYLQKDGLCALQVLGFGDKPKSGSSFSGYGVLQPHACKVYPRRRQNLGLLAEETLDLSCPEAARLFLKAELPLGQIHLKGEVPYGRSGNNDDEAFLKGLLLAREEMIHFLSVPTAGETYTPQVLSRRFATLLKASEEIQERSTHGEADIFAGLSELARDFVSNDISGFSRTDDAADESSVETDQLTLTTPQSSVDADRVIEKNILFPLGIGIMNEWINGDVYNDDLLFRMPLLYEVCKLYFKRFDKLNETSGQIRLDELYHSYFQKTGADVSLYMKYACYYLYRFYMDSYEDYSFVRRIRDMIMHTNLLLLLNALYVDENGKLPNHIETRLLASYEKRAFHSFGLRKEMYKKWATYMQEGEAAGARIF